MEKKNQGEVNCDHLEILKNFPCGCSLNQIIKCHGDDPFKGIAQKVCGCGCHEEKKE